MAEIHKYFSPLVARLITFFFHSLITKYNLICSVETVLLLLHLHFWRYSQQVPFAFARIGGYVNSSQQHVNQFCSKLFHLLKLHFLSMLEMLYKNRHIFINHVQLCSTKNVDAEPHKSGDPLYIMFSTGLSKLIIHKLIFFISPSLSFVSVLIKQL